MTVLAIAALAALLALAAAHLRQRGRLVDVSRQLAATERRARAAEQQAQAAENDAEAWRHAHGLLSRQLTAEVDAAIARAADIAQWAHPRPAPPVLDGDEVAAWADLIARFEGGPHDS